jgi:hypothetical protein
MWISGQPERDAFVELNKTLPTGRPIHSFLVSRELSKQFVECMTKGPQIWLENWTARAVDGWPEHPAGQIRFTGHSVEKAAQDAGSSRRDLVPTGCRPHPAAELKRNPSGSERGR